MLTINDKAYTSEYVAKAIEAFAKTQEGQRDTYRDRESALGHGGGQGHRWGVSLPAG